MAGRRGNPHHRCRLILVIVTSGGGRALAPGRRSGEIGLRIILAAAVAAAMLLFAAPPAGAAAPDTVPSAGCGTAPPEDPPRTVTVEGRARKFIMAVPEDYDPTVAHDLVFAFHGRTNANVRVRQYYNLEENARQPAIFVYPSGLPAGGGTRSWWDPGDPPAALRDYALFDALLAALTQQYCIDRSRVFAVGHSLGASFVNSLGCARGDVLRAIGTVAGGITPPESCAGKVAALILHNPEDRLVAFGQGKAARDTFIEANALKAPPSPVP